MKYADKHTLLVMDGGRYIGSHTVTALRSYEVIMLDIIAHTWRWPQHRHGFVSVAERSSPKIAKLCEPNPLGSIV